MSVGVVCGGWIDEFTYIISTRVGERTGLVLEALFCR